MSLFCAAGLALAQPLERVGAEFQVNVFTENAQSTPAIAADGNGGYVVVWSSARDGFGHGIFARRFDSTGAPQGSEFQVNVYTDGNQYVPDVAADGDGDFVVVWHSYGQDGDYPDVFARRFDSAGASLGGELQVNSFTVGYQGDARVASDADGDFVVIWTSYEQDGFYGGAFARRFASSGAPQGVEFQVNSSTISYEYANAVAFQSDGDFIVSWSAYDASSDYDVLARLYDNSGVPQGAELMVNTTTAQSQYDARIAVAGDDDFVISWTSNSQDGQFGGIFARRFDSAGSAQGGELQVNVHTVSSQEDPVIAADVDGDFVVAWRSTGQDGSGTGVFARRFSSSGAPQGGDLAVNSYTPNNQLQPVVATDGAGGFLVAWRSEGQDGSGTGVFAQRLAVSSLATLDVDGNGALQALADGLLVLRYRFGLTGTSLTNGAVGANCTRCDAAAIEPYLAGLGMTLDIDGNGALQALTDGLLVLRFLFNLTGNTLTSGVVGMGCTRCDAAAIEPYLQTLN